MKFFWIDANYLLIDPEGPIISTTEVSERIQKTLQEPAWFVVHTEGEAMNALAPTSAAVLRMSRLPALWVQRVEMRERLGAMPERLLADIGLDLAAVAREVQKPFWRPCGESLGAGTPTF